MIINGQEVSADATLTLGVYRDGSLGMRLDGEAINGAVIVAVFPAWFSLVMHDALDGLIESNGEESDKLVGVNDGDTIEQTASVVAEFMDKLKLAVYHAAGKEGITVPSDVLLDEDATDWQVERMGMDTDDKPEVTVADLSDASLILYSAFADGVITRTAVEDVPHGSVPFAVIPPSYDERVLEAISGIGESVVIEETDEGVTARSTIPNMEGLSAETKDEKMRLSARVIHFGEVVEKALGEIYGDVPEDARFGRAAFTYMVENAGTPNDATIH